MLSKLKAKTGLRSCWPFVLVSTLRASPVQVPPSAGDDIGPLSCWLKDTGLLRWKWLETTLAYWVDWGNGWDFLLFCTSLFKNFWGQIRWPQTKDGRPAESTWNILVFFGRLGLSRGRHIYGVCFCLWCGKCLLWVNSEKKKWVCLFTLDVVSYTFFKLCVFRVIICFRSIKM